MRSFGLLVCLTLLASGCLFKKATGRLDTVSSGGANSSNSTTTPALDSAPQVFVAYAGDTKTDIAVTVAGVTSGMDVRLFSGASCAGAAVATAVASGTQIDFSMTGLAAGAHSFSAKAGTSTCSTVTASYTRASCPAGYLKIDGNPALGVRPFCVMQFEAKDVGGVATSQAASAPWMNLTATAMKAQCRALNTGGATSYDLISSLEWATIAREIEPQAVNWKNGQVGLSTLAYGNSLNQQQPMAVSNVSDPFSDVTSSGNPTTNHEYRRTQILTSGESIWDFAGNAYEIVDFGMTATYTTPPPCTGSDGAQGMGKNLKNNNHCPNIADEHYLPLHEDLNMTFGIGVASVNTQSEKIILRGGGFNGTNFAGIHTYMLSAIYGPDDDLTGNRIGFRCVQRLNAVTTGSVPFAKDFESTPTLSFADTQPGEALTLHTDGQCSSAVVGAGYATSSTTSASVSTALSTGSYSLYHRTISQIGVSSACLPGPVSYAFVTCPTGYVRVAGNASRSVNPFCVAKYEMRLNGGGPTTDPAEPYHQIFAPDDAKFQCINLSVKHNLISNQEWQTLGDEIAGVSSNWSSGVVGTGFINSGVSSSTAAATSTNPSDPWAGFTVSGSATTAFRYRRSHALIRGDEIWDLAGNKPEYVDMGTAALSNQFAFPAACASGNGIASDELQTAATTCSAVGAIHYLPKTPSWNSTTGVGKFIGHTSASGVLMRGGSFDSEEFAGIYAFGNLGAVSNPSPNGYRCVYRP